MTFRDTSADITLDNANMGTRDDFEAWINDSAADATIVSDVLKKLPKKIDAAFAGYVAGNLNRQPEIDALKAELTDTVTDMGWNIDKLKLEAKERAILLHERCVEVANLKAENARLRKDAERYRWIRYRTSGDRADDTGAWVFNFPTLAYSDINPCNTAADNLDYTIDAAMKDFSTTKKEE